MTSTVDLRPDPDPSPPMPPSMDDLVEQTQWDGFWLPPWATVVDRPELRYTHATVQQSVLNMVVRVRQPDGSVDLSQLVDEVDRAHRSVPSQWLLAPRSQLPGLPVRLEAGGWQQGPAHHLRTRAVDDRFSAANDLVVRPVDRAATLIDCIQTAEQAFGGPQTAISEARVADELAVLATGRARRFVVYDPGSDTPMASGGINLYPALQIGFLWAAGTHPDHRGRGAYRALLNARLACAQRAGCSHVAVYARFDTSDPILARLQFQRHGTLQIWERASQS